jgi:hypothetical protein
MLGAFRMVDPSLREETFLRKFQELGCSLIDLCPEPVDRLDPVSRRAACRASEELLARRIVELQPGQIAVLLRSIEGNVKGAVSAAGWSGPIVTLPYPGRWSSHRLTFNEILVPVIRSLLLP